MARPARVRMRSLKPCVFARLRLFGWNVRFTGTTPLGRSWWKAGKDPVQRWHRSTDGTGLRKQASTRLAGQCGVATRSSVPRAPGPGRQKPASVSRQPLPCMARGSAGPPRRWPRSHRLGLSLPWGQRWGRAVDERGTTAGDAIGQPNLGTTMQAVPSPILTATHPVSSADRCPSTCPQGLWLFRISLSLHPFKPIAWGREAT
jgi:hypothetical protein